jgi:DNA polymerase-4
MSGQLAASLSRKRLRARTVTIKVRYADFTTVTRSHTAEDASNSEEYIADCARTLLARTDAAHRPVRLLGVGAHGLAPEDDINPQSERLF